MKIAIIGAGAAGCFAAANIPPMPGREVVIFEKTGKILQKVKVSGGGRCNVTHACFNIPELIEKYPRGKALLKKTLYRFGPQQTIDWFAAHGISLKKEADGRMFPVTDSSQTIIDCLQQAMNQQQTQLMLHHGVSSIVPENGRWKIHFTNGFVYDADKVMVSAGGFPKPENYSFLSATGHQLEPPVPSLFTFNLPSHPITSLMGVVADDVQIKVAGTKGVEKGPLLITHWGMSGPVVLRTSAWAARDLYQQQYEFDVLINWLGGTSWEGLKDDIGRIRRDLGKQSMGNRNPFLLPRRLWEFFLEQLGINPLVKWGELPASLQNKLLEKLTTDRYSVSGKTTFKEEFVTCGGVKLSEVNAQTMESRLHPGLYFGGEILDVDGITGGFNFQHAWSSGWIAAQELARI